MIELLHYSVASVSESLIPHNNISSAATMLTRKGQKIATGDLMSSNSVKNGDMIMLGLRATNPISAQKIKTLQNFCPFVSIQNSMERTSIVRKESKKLYFGYNAKNKRKYENCLFPAAFCITRRSMIYGEVYVSQVKSERDASVGGHTSRRQKIRTSLL